MPIDPIRLPFVGAKHRRKRRAMPPTLIVLHSGETNEGATAAEGMAAYFASGRTTGSAHVCVDNDSGVRCATDDERTNGAGGVNEEALHIEQAGQAAQSQKDWTDPYSQATVANAAACAKDWRTRFPNLRAKILRAADLARGERDGITTHWECTAAGFAGNDGHWDPGPNYPLDQFVSMLGNQPLAPTAKEDSMLMATIDGQTFYAFVWGVGVTIITKAAFDFSNAAKTVITKADYDAFAKLCVK